MSSVSLVVACGGSNGGVAVGTFAGVRRGPKRQAMEVGVVAGSVRGGRLLGGCGGDGHGGGGRGWVTPGGRRGALEGTHPHVLPVPQCIARLARVRGKAQTHP